MRIKDVLDAFKDQPPDQISDEALERIYRDALNVGLVTEEDINVGYTRLMDLPVRWTANGTLVLDRSIVLAEAFHQAGRQSMVEVHLDDCDWTISASYARLLARALVDAADEADERNAVMLRTDGGGS